MEAEDLDVNAELDFWENDGQGQVPLPLGGLPPPSPPPAGSQQLPVPDQHPPPTAASAARLQQAPPSLPTFQDASHVYIPTHKYPPKAVRADFTRTLTDLWQQIADSPQDEKLWLLELDTDTDAGNFFTMIFKNSFDCDGCISISIKYSFSFVFEN